MLNKIAKAATRFPQAKTPRRAVSQLNASLRKLEDQINAAGKASNPIPVLREVRASALYAEVLDMLNEPNPEIMRQPNRHMNPEVRVRAHGYTVCHALDGVTTILNKHFDLEPPTSSINRKADPKDIGKANDRAFQDQILPVFEQKMKAEFKSSWATVSTIGGSMKRTPVEKEVEIKTRMAAVLSAVAPEVVADFGLSYPKESVLNNPRTLYWRGFLPKTA